MSLSVPTAKNKIATMLRVARPQLLLLLFISLFHLLASRDVLPSISSLTQTITDLFDQHGLSLVAACSFLENIVGVNAYFPGSIAILAGMALAKGDPIRGLLTYFAIVIPAGIANLLSYVLGRRLTKWSRKNSPEIGKKGWLLFFTTYWHPHLAATTSFASGTNGLPLKRYLPMFAIASLFWSAFWGLTVYHFGNIAIRKEGDLTVLIYLYLAIWAGWDMYRASREAKTTRFLGVNRNFAARRSGMTDQK